MQTPHANISESVSLFSPLGFDSSVFHRSLVISVTRSDCANTDRSRHSLASTCYENKNAFEYYFISPAEVVYCIQMIMSRTNFFMFVTCKCCSNRPYMISKRQIRLISAYRQIVWTIIRLLLWSSLIWVHIVCISDILNGQHSRGYLLVVSITGNHFFATL